jgi:hypothetical protein
MPLRSMIVASALMVATLSTASADTFEPNMNRPGGDYKNFEVRSPDDCQTGCLQDVRCKAWTWVKKGIQGPAARCWLKTSQPAPVPDKNCVSGRKGGSTL